MIHSLNQLSCPRFVNSHPALHLTQHMSCKLLQYPVGLLLIRQIPCHCRSPNDGSCNIYGCIVDVSKFTPAQRQQHAVMLLEHYHELCNRNDPSSTFVSLPPIPNIESFSQSTISSIDSGSLDRNRADENIQQPTTSEVVNTETVMTGNEDIDTPPPQDI